MVLHQGESERPLDQENGVRFTRYCTSITGVADHGVPPSVLYEREESGRMLVLNSLEQRVVKSECFPGELLSRATAKSNLA